MVRWCSVKWCWNSLRPASARCWPPAGMEFVIFDMEHGRCDIPLLAEMIASCRGSNIVPMARVPDVTFRSAFAGA